MRTITDLALGQGHGSEVGLAPDLAKSAPAQGYRVPKTWFTDPFALLDSLGLGYKSAPSSLSYETLRNMAEKNSVISAIHNTRIHQVSSFVTPQPNRYSIGFKISHRDDKFRRLSTEEQAVVRHHERFLLNTGKDYDIDRDDLETYVKKLTRDRLIYDQIATETTLRYSGKPFSFYAVPANTIRLASARKKRGLPYSKDGNAPKYVQVVDGVIVNEYTSDELGFDVANPRTDLRAYGYGYSELEQLITTVTSHLWAEEWNRKVFSQGATTKGILNIKGNIPPNQLDAFKRQWLAQISGVSNAWRTPVINSNEDMQWINLQPTNQEMGFEGWIEYLIKISCAIYLIDPAEINFDTRGGMGAPMFMSTNEQQQKASKDRGLRPLLKHIAKHVNRHILWRLDDRFEFEFVGLDAKTEDQAVQLRLQELQSYKTLNEVREHEQLPPVPHGDIVPNPSYIGYRNQKEMAEAQQGQMGGMPGATAGFGPQGMGAEKKPGPAEQGAQEEVHRELGDKPPKRHRRVHDRLHPYPSEDWEATYRSVSDSDLQKAVSPFEALLDD